MAVIVSEDHGQETHAFGLARKAGMRNINIDLIYAVPYQSRESWLETLRRGIDLGPDHVSTYCLTFEEGTLLFRRYLLKGSATDVIETTLFTFPNPPAASSWLAPFVGMLPGPDYDALRSAVLAAPANATVSARPGPLAHLAERPRVISPPEYDDGKPVDYVVR